MQKDLFLPNFCNVRIIFLTVLLAELVAIVLTLAPLSSDAHYNWHYVVHNLLLDFAKTSLFMQCVALTSVFTLCILRPLLTKLENNWLVGIFSYFLIIVITVFMSEIAWRLNEKVNFVDPLFSPGHHLFLLRNLSISFISGAIVLSVPHFLKLWHKNTIFLVYVVFLVVTFALSELASTLVAPDVLRYQASQHQLFLLKNIGISAIISAIGLRYVYVQYHWRKEAISSAQSRIQALQARIRPHFLFNSMNTIASLIRFAPDKAEQAVEDFSDLFRASLMDTNKQMTFGEEIELCQQYIRIEMLRLEDRVKAIWQVESIPSDALLPPLCIQPLVENAIYHGIQPLPEGGTISIVGMFDGKYINIDIENPLGGSTSYHKGNQIAQKNIALRLETYYGETARLSIQRHANTYRVNLRFPYRSVDNPVASDSMH